MGFGLGVSSRRVVGTATLRAQAHFVLSLSTFATPTHKAVGGHRLPVPTLCDTSPIYRKNTSIVLWLESEM